MISCSAAPPITHAHIYGIDLATSSELIAFHKTPEDIAQEIGADAVIYQSLSDLEASVAELSPRPNQKFEVGVFCGKYITPIDDGYIEHLERVRGERMRMKEEEKARQALVNGVADARQRRIVGEGTGLDIHGKVVPASEAADVPEAHGKRKLQSMNGNGRQEDDRPHSRVKDTQDIALYNVHDHRR